MVQVGINMTKIRVQLYLLGVFQCGVSVVWWLQTLQQAGVKVSAAFNEPPCCGKLLLQQFIEAKCHWIEDAECCMRDM